MLHPTLRLLASFPISFGGYLGIQKIIRYLESCTSIEASITVVIVTETRALHMQVSISARSFTLSLKNIDC